MGNWFSIATTRFQYWIDPKLWGFFGWSTLYGMAQLSMNEELQDEKGRKRCSLALKELFSCLPYVLPCYTCASNAGIFIKEFGIPSLAHEVMPWLDKFYHQVELSNKKKTHDLHAHKRFLHRFHSLSTLEGMDRKSLPSDFLEWCFQDVALFLGAIFLVLDWSQLIALQWLHRFVASIALICPEGFVATGEVMVPFFQTKDEAFVWLYSRPSVASQPLVLRKRLFDLPLRVD